MVVTDSHPMPSEHGEVKEAGSLEKGGAMPRRVCIDIHDVILHARVFSVRWQDLARSQCKKPL